MKEFKEFLDGFSAVNWDIETIKSEVRGILLNGIPAEAESFCNSLDDMYSQTDSAVALLVAVLDDIKSFNTMTEDANSIFNEVFSDEEMKAISDKRVELRNIRSEIFKLQRIIKKVFCLPSE